MIDLEEIIPKALVDYPSLLTRIEARCAILPDATNLNLDTVYSLIRVSATWNCDLMISNTSVKLISTLVVMQTSSRSSTTTSNSPRKVTCCGPPPPICL